MHKLQSNWFNHLVIFQYNDIELGKSTLRDSGKIVHFIGTVFKNVPDNNGSQVQVTTIIVEE